jgi:hypothetical protein
MSIGISLGIKLKTQKISGTPSAIAPVNTVLPVVTGSFVVGQVLTSTDGIWTGTAPITYTYQWQRNSVDISGQTNNTYTLVQTDADFDVRCVVTATNVAGSASANSNSGYVWDADYQAIINEATTQSYTLPTSGQRVNQNKLMIALKDGGIYSKLDIMYMFANDGSQEFATLNWKNPTTFQASLINAPTFTSDLGFNSDGATAYVDTNYNIVTSRINASLLQAHCAWVTRTSPTAIRVIRGVPSSNNIERITSASSGLLRFHVTGGSVSPSLDTRSTTFCALIKSGSSTDVRARVNGAFSNHTGNAASDTSEDVALLRSGSSYPGTDIRISFFSEGGTLSDTEAVAYETAINTYMGTL